MESGLFLKILKLCFINLLQSSRIFVVTSCGYSMKPQWYEGAMVWQSYGSGDIDGVIRGGGIEGSGNIIGVSDCEDGDCYSDNAWEVNKTRRNEVVVAEWLLGGV